jgi:5-methylcytosine-specific restriction enzyme subunit McrC
VTGSGLGFALLFDMNELFESYVGALARKVFGRAGLKVTLQGPKLHLAQHANGAAAFELRPDIVVSNGSGVEFIIDTKWKRLETAAHREGVGSADVYQMHAYATQYGAPDVVLLYPHHAGLGPWQAIRAQYTLRELGLPPVADTRQVSVATIGLKDLDFVELQIGALLAARRVAATA